MKKSILLFLGVSGLLWACSHAHSERTHEAIHREVPSRKAAQLDTFFHQLQKTANFNGAVLVSQHGKIVYRGAFGYKNLFFRDTLTTDTPFQIASVSKQFTAVAVLQLKERGALQLDDPVWKFISGFPYDSSITIRHLLCHRSGLPNYQYGLERYMNTAVPTTNTEIVQKLIQFRPRPYLLPNMRFNYNNTNYVLLAYIVEQLSGMSFREYVENQLFRPAEMTRSFVYDGTSIALRETAAQGYSGNWEAIPNDYLDSVTGDKSIYTTVEDLFRWDNALYSGKIISKNSLEEAFQPAHDDPRLVTKNYGFGWRLQLLPDGEWLTFHTGWWHGFKTYYLRRQTDQSTIILLSNVANRFLSKVNIAQAILYPEKARLFLKADGPEASDSENSSEPSLASLYRMAQPPIDTTRKVSVRKKATKKVIRKKSKKRRR